jgi:hypothetical protein
MLPDTFGNSAPKLVFAAACAATIRSFSKRTLALLSIAA